MLPGLGIQTRRTASGGRSFPVIPWPVLPANRPHLPPQPARRSRRPHQEHPRWHGSTARRAAARPCDRSCRRDCETGRQVLSSLWHATPPEAARHFPELLGSHQSPCLCFFVHCSVTKAPSLHRHYPASPVLWASPTSRAALPCPRGRQVAWTPQAPRGISRVATELLCRTCRHQCPGGLGQRQPRSFVAQWQPSPCLSWVGVHIRWFRDHCHPTAWARCCLSLDFTRP